MRESFRDEEVMKTRFDQWRYITIVTPIRTYDFIMSSLTDTLDLVTAVNEAMLAHKREEVRTRILKI